MFRFEHSEYLYYLAAIPVLIGIYMLYKIWVRKDFNNLGNNSVVKRLIDGWSVHRQWIKFILLLISISFIIVAWSNPQWGNKKEKVKAKSADIFIAIDISQSMLAQDISPSRLEKVKKFGQKLILSLRGERIGVILFAGQAYLQMPLTTDYSAAELFVSSANTNLAGTQGTAITEAIDLAERSFEPDNKHHKALIMISDGENHDEEAIDRAKRANENGLKIFTLGAGTVEGGFIPIMIRGRETYKKDKEEKLVRSRMNEDLLREIARAGDGAYFSIEKDEEAIKALKDQIARIEKREVEQRSYTEYASYFQYFLAIGILFLILEFLISNKSSNWLKKQDIFEV
jgi:Ca-activated chloride channel family protein